MSPSCAVSDILPLVYELTVYVTAIYANSHKYNKAFIDIRLRPRIATPLVVVGYRFSLPRIAILPITAKRDVIQKVGST